MDNEHEFIDLNEVPIVIYVPASAIELYIEAKIYEDGEIKRVGLTMNTKEVRDAMNDADRNYIPDDAMFFLTEKGRRDLEKTEINE